MDRVSMGILFVLSILSTIKSASSISPALLLTPYITNNKTADAKLASTVNSSLFLGVPSHSGFLTVYPKLNSNTFFWYFPVQDQPVETTPWIVWLQGGPGVSSLAGLFDEIGPFEYKDGALKRRQHAWSADHSLVFIDNPVGTGYSFTDSEEGYATNMTAYSSHLYVVLQQFLRIFPELRKAPLFIAGESYAGRYVPALASKIVEAGKLNEEWEITLGGLIMGNPVMNREDIVNITNAYYQWGIIDSEGVLAVKHYQDMYATAVNKGENELAKLTWGILLTKLDEITMQQQSYNLLADDYELEGFKTFLNTEEVREALHVGQVPFNFRNDTVNDKLVPDFLSNVEPVVEEVLSKHKILIYCGQLDLTAPCVPSSEARRRKWQWGKRQEFLDAPRVPWWYNESVAGYVKNGGGLEEVLVRGAGHLAPIDKPAQVLKLVSSFIQSIEMELPPNYKPDNSDSVTSPPITTEKTTSTTKVIPTTEMPTTTKSASTVEPNQNKPTDKPAQTSSSTAPSVAPAAKAEGISIGTIFSIVLNVILIILFALGAFLYYRLKRRNEDFFYNNVENNSDDIFLT